MGCLAELAISKKVISPIEADETKEFSFTIQLNERISGTFKAKSSLTDEEEEVTFTDGRAAIKVKGTETKTNRTASRRRIPTVCGRSGTSIRRRP